MREHSVTAGMRCPPTAPPPAIQSRMDEAARLGLSDWKQVTRKEVPRAEQQARLTKMRRIVLGACEQMQLAHQRDRRRFKVAMVTLTYAPGQVWEPKDISRYMQRCRDWLARRGHKLRAVWVLELQKRGAPHYHVLVWLPKGLKLPKADKQGWWQKGFTRMEWARKPAGYMAKYTSKGESSTHRLPVGARIYGVYGCPVDLGWWRSPGWMRQIAEQGMSIRRKKGGWLIVDQLGLAWKSPWRLIQVNADSIEIEWVGWSPASVVSAWHLEKALKLEEAA